MGDTDLIKSKISIEELISEYINIQKSGSGFTALCPFHNEKTPSFHISPSRQIYKCFGCGESGDVFSFIQKMDGLDFPQALNKLAKKTGVEITTRINKEIQDKRRIDKENKLKILDIATSFFQINLLQDKHAKKYLKQRGVGEKIIRKFRLGLALDEWNSLENYMLKKGFSKKDLESVGLIKKNDKGNFYDRFRNRIIFPIFNQENIPVAFSGRDLSGKDNVAKYLNSPETFFFNKSEILYGLNFAKQEARKRKYFIVVEGQMDLIMSHQAGFENTVATSGTSLTEQHLKKMSYFSKNIIFAFDPDDAGVEAAFRGIKKALALDFEVKILQLPDSKHDPADIILKNEQEWAKIVADAKNIIDFFIIQILNKKGSIKNKVNQLNEKVFPFLSQISNPIEKGNYISKISKLFNVDEKFVLEALNSIKRHNLDEEHKISKNNIKNIEKFAIFPKEYIMNKTKKRILKQLTAIYFWQNSIKKEERLIVQPKKILDKIESFIERKFLDQILNLKDDYIDDLVIEVEQLYNHKDQKSLNADLKIFYERLEKLSIKEEISRLQKKLSFVQDQKKKNKLLKKIQQLTSKI